MTSIRHFRIFDSIENNYLGYVQFVELKAPTTKFTIIQHKSLFQHWTFVWLYKNVWLEIDFILILDIHFLLIDAPKQLPLFLLWNEIKKKSHIPHFTLDIATNGK